jgi:hypothetical protein
MVDAKHYCNWHFELDFKPVKNGDERHLDYNGG